LHRLDQTIYFFSTEHGTRCRWVKVKSLHFCRTAPGCASAVSTQNQVLSALLFHPQMTQMNADER
jgi:hypothetical protein